MVRTAHDLSSFHGKFHGLTQLARKRIPGGVVAATMALLLLAMPRAGMTEDLPLGRVLVDTLGLGKGNGNANGGCNGTLIVPEVTEGDGNLQADQVYTAQLLAADISPQLAGICDLSTNVGSASSLAAPVGGTQSTKTATQFNVARKRIEARLRRQGSFGDGAIVLASLDTDAISPIADATVETQGWAVFGGVEQEQSERKITAYESGYDATTNTVIVGADYAWPRAIAGVWVGYSDTEGDSHAGSPATNQDPQELSEFARDILNSPTDLTTLCGALPGEGRFEDSGFNYGIYGGARVGKYGFVDAEVSVADRDYSYQRDACAIEFPSTESPVGVARDTQGRGRLFIDNGTPGLSDENVVDDLNCTLDPTLSCDRIADDVFAGRIRGETSIHEFDIALRAGVHVPIESIIVSPQVGLRYRRAEIDGFSEEGRSLIENTVMSNVVTAEQSATVCPGGPEYLSDLGVTGSDSGVQCIANYDANTASGLEIAYHDQVRESLRSEIGAIVAVPLPTEFGSIVPYAGATWRHEFDNDRDRVAFHMAGDHRTNPATFEFVTDEPDADDAVLTAGVTVNVGEDVAATLEVSHVAYNDLVESTAVSARIRLRF